MVKRLVVGELALHEPEPLAQLLPHLLPERRARIRLDRVVRDLREVSGGPFPAGEADQRETWRQEPAVGQVIDRRQQLLAGQVAGDTEEHQHARPGKPRDAPGPRLPERIWFYAGVS